MHGQQQRSQLCSVMQDEAREGLLADMDGEEFAEEGGAGGEDAEGSGAEARVAVEEEQE